MEKNKELTTEELKKKRMKEATKKFEDKTYKKVMIRFRYDKDQELLDFIETEKKKGIGVTELVREALWNLYMDKE